ncbi:sigma-70 family RNA polymerase sigma factor [Thiococcus pfennigii]|uniref:sigma-70 family RNA polymerase sigma factor n=1 Tax=Thiococcus pfennigii TaxID=1057 RepID=UPI001908B0C1|nr:sigma-70 family RNA polymerase sigma factor [Thiococcus pfennigii]MBK1700557.1 RNA polymerase subunit sigma [Thiococcus pfennigii]MBK1732284.1 RNA polymerase subunit sigma [Thiococcus pfennigii]
MNETLRFEELIVPHLDAAYNLARWLTRNDATAQEVVQESCLRALKALPRFRGDDARAWLLTIVRNQSYSWLKKTAGPRLVDIDDETGLDDDDQARLSHKETPETWLSRTQDRMLLTQTLDALPATYREVIVLKDLEDMSYKEIAQVIGTPLGTVMSRLARGREMLRTRLLASEWTT